MRGHLGPACNAVGYVDRQVWGINHLYSDPVWKRLRVSTNRCQILICFIHLERKHYAMFNGLVLQACTFSSPSSGPLRKDAPSWCRAPFEPEGLLRSEYL